MIQELLEAGVINYLPIFFTSVDGPKEGRNLVHVR
jgi:hypothetical protein